MSDPTPDPAAPIAGISATALNRAAALHRAGHRDAAADAYRRLLAVDPTQPDALHLLGVAVRGGNPALGRRLLARALAVHPFLTVAWINRARAWKDAGHPPAAAANARRAIAIDPALAAGYGILAESLAHGGRSQAAVGAQTRALCLDPGNRSYAHAVTGLRRLAGLENDVARVLPGDSGQVSATLSRIASYFDSTIRTHGTTAAGVSYSDPGVHTASLQRLTRILDACPGDGARIHDIGCGYGRLFEMVSSHPALRRGHYWGCDLSPAMVETARRRITDPRASFAVASLADEMADVTVIAGTYNLRFDRDDGAWWDYIRANLRHLARLSRVGLAFSLLSRHAPRQQDALFYADPGTVLTFVLTDLTPNAVLYHDCAGDEFAVLATGPFRWG